MLTRLLPILARLALASIAITLAACAQTPPPAIKVKTVQVDIAVPVRCIDPAKVPAKPARATFNGDAVHDVAVLEQEAVALRDALERLLALIGPCVVEPGK